MEQKNIQQTQLPPWTADDFAAGNKAPFDWLWKQGGDPVTQEQLVALAKAKAAELGVKSFASMWRVYKGQKRREAAEAALSFRSNVTEFTGQPLTLMCGQYECTDEGVSIRLGNGQRVTVCTHPILPVRRLVGAETGETKLELAWRRGSGDWRRKIVPKTTLSGTTAIISLAASDVDVTSENARYLVKYLAELDSTNYETLPTERSIDRLGWVKGEGFVPYCEGLHFDGDETYRHLYETVHPEGNADAWLGLMRSMRAAESIPARIMLAASFASALVEPVGALPFFVHLWGGSGAGKTVALKVAASVWADPHMGKYVTSFHATSVGLELTAGFCHSLPLCVDELQIDARRDLDETVYQLSEGVGKKRGAKNGGIQKSATWQLCVLTTGEMPLTTPQSRGGVLNRCIEIDCKDQSLFKHPAALVSCLEKNYGHAGKAFTDVVRDMGEDTVRGWYNAYVKELGRSQATDKQIMAAACILTADHIADAYLFKDNRALTVADILPYLVTKEASDVNRRAFGWLIDWIAANPMRFRHNDFGDWTGECWGMHDTEHIYIIGSVLNAKMNEAGYNPTAFLSWARREGVIEGGTGKDKNGKNKRISGQVCRCIWIKRSKIGMIDQE